MVSKTKSFSFSINKGAYKQQLIRGLGQIKCYKAQQKKKKVLHVRLTNLRLTFEKSGQESRRSSFQHSVRNRLVTAQIIQQTGFLVKYAELFLKLQQYSNILMATIAAFTNSSIQEQVENKPQWSLLQHGSFQTQTITSLDELKAKIKSGGMRPAVLTPKGLYIKNGSPKALSFTSQN